MFVLNFFLWGFFGFLVVIVSPLGVVSREDISPLLRGLRRAKAVTDPFISFMDEFLVYDSSLCPN